MKKIGIINCSNSGLFYLGEKYKKMNTIYCKLIFNGKEYVDYRDIKAEDFYNKLVETNVIPKTAQPSTGEMLELFDKMAEEGYDEAIFIPISSGMSGTYQGALIAANMCEKIKVHVHDSKAVGYMQGYQIIKAIEMVENGRTSEEIIKELENIRDNKLYLYFTVETLKYLVKNGRISNAAGFIGGALKIKPILEIDPSKEGRVETIEKIRTTKKSLNKIIEEIKEKMKNGKIDELFIIHANNDELVNYVKGEFPEIEFNVGPLSPVVGAHTGPGAIGIGYVLK